MMFGLSILLIVSSWVGTFGYLQPTLNLITTACSGLGLFISLVVLYGVWEYFERGIRALKQELLIDVSESSEDHRHFVHGLGNLVKTRENGHSDSGSPLPKDELRASTKPTLTPSRK